MAVYLDKELLYIELTQWQRCDTGNVLASFQTCLTDLLYPVGYDGAISGVDVDLLMEPSKNFPGIIAPKIELSSRTTVEEVICMSNQKGCNLRVVNPKTVVSDPTPSCCAKDNRMRQKKVCHSVCYHRSKRCPDRKRSTKPLTFSSKRGDDCWTSKKPQRQDGNPVLITRCWQQRDECSVRKRWQEPPQKEHEEIHGVWSRPAKFHTRPSRTRNKPPIIGSECKHKAEHSPENCDICSKYNLYFDSTVYSCEASAPRLKDECCIQKAANSLPVQDFQHQSTRSSMKPMCIPAHYRSAAFRVQPLSQMPKSPQNDCCFSENRDVGKKPSLAQQIHERLKQTLDCTMSCPSVNFPTDCIANLDGGLQAWETSRFQDSRPVLYSNLGKFYKYLRTC